MSLHQRHRPIWLALATVLLVGACGHSEGGSAAANSSPTPGTPAAAGCSNTPATRVLSAAVGAETVPVQILGEGSAAVVLSNQSDEDLCAWLAFAAVLSANGYRVALWDYRGSQPLDELAAVADAVHTDGATTLVLMGASKGAKVSLVTARQMNAAYVVGVVSLSAEASLRSDIDVASAVAGLPTPTLLVTATEDPYGSATALDPIRAGIADPQVLRVPGADHGTSLLAHADVAAAVLAFLHRVTAA